MWTHLGTSEGFDYLPVPWMVDWETRSEFGPSTPIVTATEEPSDSGRNARHACNPVNPTAPWLFEANPEYGNTILVKVYVYQVA